MVSFGNECLPTYGSDYLFGYMHHAVQGVPFHSTYMSIFFKRNGMLLLLVCDFATVVTRMNNVEQGKHRPTSRQISVGRSTTAPSMSLLIRRAVHAVVGNNNIAHINETPELINGK